jgi:hypothetical protein
MKFNHCRHWICRPSIQAIATFGLAFALTACVTNSTGWQPAAPHAGDPSLTGAAYLLSEPDFRAILVVARRRLERVLPACTISSIDVIAADKIEAHFCEHAGPYQAWSGRFTVKRIRGEWKVVDQVGRKPPDNERVII